MEVEITRKFCKQVESCIDKRLRNQVAEVILAVQQSESLNAINNLKKLSGFKNIYRIRLGQFRIGLKVVNGKVIFAAFDHRSDIYKYFP